MKAKVIEIDLKIDEIQLIHIIPIIVFIMIFLK
jgi:hypothetical protein